MTNVFVSFDHDDQKQVGGFRSLKTNPDHPLQFNDHSIKDPVAGPSGKPLRYPPSDPRSKPVRDTITKKFDSASKLVVLIGDETHNSEWVTWEINTFYDLKSKISQEQTWKRIRGMTLKESEGATIPIALMNGRSTKPLLWNPEELDKWIDLDPSS